uniref:Uncharacterized protein n=1 Tax=Zooxanthella nutricula TaxID=1333877 RepID=A0A7S2NDR0_9DINO|mmetsp:Transcript_25105/g.75426  ORF Transcript_25105/g.75426 Transcript_25105/m.75426 type:complete len:122 (+) Transcript_25105:3-368(+)
MWSVEPGDKVTFTVVWSARGGECRGRRVRRDDTWKSENVGIAEGRITQMRDAGDFRYGVIINHHVRDCSRSIRFVDRSHEYRDGDKARCVAERYGEGHPMSGRCRCRCRARDMARIGPPRS